MTTIRFHLAGITLLAAALVAGGCATDSELDAPDELFTPRAEIAAVLAEHPEAEQISDNQIAWNGGSVVMTFPDESEIADDASARAAWHGCPSGWYCFYQHQNFGGRRLQFRDCARGGTSQYFSNYGFENQTTSWVVNRSLNFVNVNDYARNLWNEDSHSSSSNVGAAKNDRADYFICYG